MHPGKSGKPGSLTDKQHYSDVQDFSETLLKGVDTVVYLADISNNPIGNKFEGGLNIEDSVFRIQLPMVSEIIFERDKNYPLIK